ncbi:hypothetical protein ASPZODRAFT_153586 [Penicilliopsis zonata CBS 506.65]|uniref:UBX domain-containing protein n=1 Tax=Penicilliopsis zonata CBS 506.65 TaxID=1073090 RepID=A0A1L9SC21_9EURO|nr:hypothetical protein ASPZODRAFT_153586 [Penicilliopsis zonata CBS 506.65]OJJ44689.1 hypothetical protein ASPZODRAFT_153586 [Penicilliopsis zonata CBS 506.65]
MSSHVVVIDTTARRATVKTTPAKYLADILQESCTKLGLDAGQYGLKHKSKQLDLSLSIRLSGLSSGAKLELVQLSRSPAVVTIALQLPESEAHGVPNGRLLDKFPSNTTLWIVLRKFEAGVAGNASIRNLTARGVPSTGTGETGSGRLYYEIPVLQVVGRELSTFTDLQKSLAQLGFNSGNVLMRLSFRKTDEPLEEAMVKIEEYFKSFSDVMSNSTPTTGPPPEEVTVATTAHQNTANSELPQQPPSSVVESTPHPPSRPTQPIDTTSTATRSPSAVPNISSRPVMVFSPPTSGTPQSAQTTYNDTDYVPSMDQAQAHQRRLNQASRPTRLPTDAEIASKAAAEHEKLAAVKDVDVKVRFPDQSQVIVKFGQHDTAKTLYDFVRSCLVEPLASEKFIITSLPTGLKPGHTGAKIQTAIPDTSEALLIQDLGMVGRVLVNFTWDTSVPPAVRESRENLLRLELRSQAQKLKVDPVPDPRDEPESGSGRSLGASGGDQQDKEKPGLRKGGVPKWLKLPGKK